MVATSASNLTEQSLALAEQAARLAELANDAAKRAEARAAIEEAWPIEPEVNPDDGLAPVIRFTKTYARNPENVYTYAAIGTKGQWYLTASTDRHARVFSWQELMEWLDTDTDSVVILAGLDYNE